MLVPSAQGLRLFPACSFKAEREPDLLVPFLGWWQVGEICPRPIAVRREPFFYSLYKQRQEQSPATCPTLSHDKPPDTTSGDHLGQVFI